MIRYTWSIALLAMITFGQNAFADQQFPSPGMFQEMGGTVGRGKVSIDLFNSSDYRDSVRFGLPRGELMYSRGVAGVGGDMLGYKHAINGNLSAYGLVSYDSNADDTEMVFGTAYSGGDSKFWWNLNAEMLSPGGNADSTLEIKGGAYYAINTEFTGRMYLVGEVVMDNEDSTTDIYGALHFVANKNVNIDIGIYKSIGGAGNNADESTVGLPVFFRLTLLL